MKQIGYIVPNEEMAEFAEKIFRTSGYDIKIEVGNAELGIKKAEDMVKEGIKVIISRGGTALFIKKSLNIPVIEIPITIEDIAEAILKASTLGETIAIVGFNNLLKGLEPLNPLLKIKLEQVYINNQNEIEPEIMKLKQKSVDVIIGGKSQCRIADKLQLKSVFLKSGPHAIYHAYQEAETFLNTLMNERRRAEEIRTILDYAKEGYIAINRHGEITLINSSALKLKPQCVGDPLGKPLKEIFPELENLTEVLTSSKEYWHDITAIGSTNILYSRIPLRVDKEVVGAIATLHDVNIVQEAESKIRSNFISKGWYASYSLEDIIGESNMIKKALDYAKQFASVDSTILITGESGVGKEIFSQGIHNRSKRKKGPFVGVNCASLPESILESELFGYDEGAFTGARKSGKPGLFELAHRGTIFLDEVSEIPLSLQGRLLRILQEKKIMRLGSDKVIPIDTRIIAASNRNLAFLVREKKFREDLFFRLNVLRLHIPPLRERTEDISLLVAKFLNGQPGRKKITFTDSAMEALRNYLWPGNIRELQNLIERIAVMSDSSTTINEQILKNALEENEPLLNCYSDEKYFSPKKKDHISKEQITKAIRIADGNKERAAAILGIHRSTLWRLLKRINNGDYI